MNKRTKILFVVYLVLAPVVYFISSAHTPNKHKHQIEKFVHKYAHKVSAQSTIIAFIGSTSKAVEYQKILAQTFQGKATKTMVFTVPEQASETIAKATKQTAGVEVYTGKRYFKKAGIYTGKKAPTLQLFLVNRQKKLVYQEQHYDNQSLDLSNLVAQIDNI